METKVKIVYKTSTTIEGEDENGYFQKRVYQIREVEVENNKVEEALGDMGEHFGSDAEDFTVLCIYAVNTKEDLSHFWGY